MIVSIQINGKKRLFFLVRERIFVKSTSKHRVMVRVVRNYQTLELKGSRLCVVLCFPG